MSVKAQKMNVVNLVHIVREAGEEPGRDSPIWEEVRRSYHGNQEFNNDSMFIYNLPDELDPTPVQARIIDLCKDSLNEDTIVFSVSW